MAPARTCAAKCCSAPGTAATRSLPVAVLQLMLLASGPLSFPRLLLLVRFKLDYFIRSRPAIELQRRAESNLRSVDGRDGWITWRGVTLFCPRWSSIPRQCYSPVDVVGAFRSAVERDVVEQYSKEDMLAKADAQLLKAAQEEAAPVLRRLEDERDKLRQQLADAKVKAQAERERILADPTAAAGLFAQNGKIVLPGASGADGSEVRLGDHLLAVKRGGDEAAAAVARGRTAGTVCSVWVRARKRTCGRSVKRDCFHPGPLGATYTGVIVLHPCVCLPWLLLYRRRPMMTARRTAADRTCCRRLCCPSSLAPLKRRGRSH